MATNGYLPASDLTAVQGTIQLETRTAKQYLAMKAYASSVGITITIAPPAGGYRSHSMQVDMRNRPWLYHITPGVVPGLPSDHGFGTEVDIASGLTWVIANGGRFGFTRTKLRFNDPNHFHYDGTTVASGTTSPTEGEEEMTQADLDQINIMIQRATRYRLYKNSATNAIMAFNITSGDIMDNTQGQAEINNWMAMQLVGHGENAVVVSQAEWDALRDRAAKIKAD